MTSNTNIILGLMGTLRRIISDIPVGKNYEEMILDIIRCVEYQTLVPELQKDSKQGLKDLKERMGEALVIMNQGQLPQNSAPPLQQVPQPFIQEEIKVKRKRKEPMTEKKGRNKKSKKQEGKEEGNVTQIEEAPLNPSNQLPLEESVATLEQILNSMNHNNP